MASGGNIARITLDAAIIALTVSGNSIALGDDLGRIHVFDLDARLIWSNHRKGTDDDERRWNRVCGVRGIGDPDRVRHWSIRAGGHEAVYVIVERLTTTGPKDIQKRYGEISKSIVAKFGGRYLSRSQDNTLLEGPGPVACCMAIIEFPSSEAAQRWYASPENQTAAKIRQSGATFRIVTIQGLPRENDP